MLRQFGVPRPPFVPYPYSPLLPNFWEQHRNYSHDIPSEVNVAGPAWHYSHIARGADEDLFQGNIEEVKRYQSRPQRLQARQRLRSSPVEMTKPRHKVVMSRSISSAKSLRSLASSETSDPKRSRQATPRKKHDVEKGTRQRVGRSYARYSRSHVISKSSQAGRRKGKPMAAASSSSSPEGIMPHHGLASMTSKERAISKSCRLVRSWLRRHWQEQPENPCEGKWSFVGRNWQSGVMHSYSSPSQQWLLRFTYQEKGDEEKQCFILDCQNPAQAQLASVSADLEAIRASCRLDGPLDKSLGHRSEGASILFRLEWSKGAFPERIVTDLLIVGRLKNGRSYITRNPTPHEDVNNLEKPKKWRWPLKEPAKSSRWAAYASVLDVAFRPSCADSEIYLISEFDIEFGRF
ncbi:MAG: hypothetical protein CYPHOPRED_004714 [Cyphobasidiales sp. Tagirdzhanova-0007]|nr:MAG: hypothetical protein CYPHOPRED_004714 [Cyphobasidiales sp. Tagirdzhanova-0007]